MEAGPAAGARDVDHLREHSIGWQIWPEVLRDGERTYVENETVVSPIATPVAVD
jgi:hypothetical protein